MELIKQIESRRAKNGHLEKWGVFKCPICGQNVEKRLMPGMNAATCSKRCGGIRSKKEASKNLQKKKTVPKKYSPDSVPEECKGCGYWETDGCKFSRVHGFTRTGYLKGRTCREAGIYTKKYQKANTKPTIIRREL